MPLDGHDRILVCAKHKAARAGVLSRGTLPLTIKLCRRKPTEPLKTKRDCSHSISGMVIVNQSPKERQGLHD
jgi:hypothetical protein